MEGPTLSRRTFLKASTVAGLASAVGGAAYSGLKEASPVNAAAASSTKIVKTCCRACIGKCGVLAHVKDGRVIKLEGDPEQPMTKGAMCAKGLSGIQALYHPNRNKYPMKRVGARGENKWMRISWDEALDTIAKQLMETRAKYGAETVFASTGGGGNPEFMSINRFCNSFGTPNWFEPGSSQCYMPRTLTYNLMYGQTETLFQTTSIADGECSEIYFPDDTPMKTLVMWGTGPAYNSPSQGGRAVVELRARGVRTVVIDPRFTPDASKADVWLPVRPGTDVALMLSWIRYIIAHNLYDAEFVMRWTNLPFLVNTQTKMFLRPKDGKDETTFMVWDKKTNSAKPMAYPWNDNLDPALEGAFTVDGVQVKTGFQMLKERAEPYTLEKAEKICWVDASRIEKAIKLYAKNTPSGISLGVATDQNPNSVQAAMGACTIDAIMGNVGRPGSLMQNFKGSGFEDSMVSPLFKLLPKEQLLKRLGGTEHKGLLNWGVAHNPTVLQAIQTGKPYRPRVWLERSGNKLATMANSTQWAEAAQGMDFIVHMYMYPTSFSAYADILLPTTEWLETDYVIPSLNTLCVRQAVVHTWETMNETLIWAKLAKRCADLGHEGCKNAFDPRMTAPEPPYWHSMEEFHNGNCMHFIHMPFPELAKRAPYEFAPYKEWKQYYTYKRIDPKTGRPQGFGTQSKKFQVYGEVFINLGRTGMPFAPFPLPPSSKDYDALPYYMEPAESPLEDSELSRQFPLVMTNGRIPVYHHGTLRNIPWLREIYPAPEISIHPSTAATNGIKQADWVWVESQRGKIRARAYVTEGIDPRVVFMERFWNPETLDTKTHGWQEMNVNVLSRNAPPYNDVAGTYTLRGYLVRISKADGPPEGVWTQPAQFKAWLPQPSDPTKPVEV